MEDSKYLFNFDKDGIISFLANDNYIVVNRSLIKEFGLKEAILLGELASEFNYYKKKDMLDEDGYFYSTIENVKESTSLSSYEQKKCLDKLSERGIVDVNIKGIPATRHIKINSLQLINLFANFLETSFRKNEKLVSENFDTNSNNNNNNNNKKENILKEKFIKPTLEEVKAYCLERNNNVDAETFYDYFETGGWVDSKGNKVKNWKQKIITWEKNTKTNKEDERQKRIEEWLKSE